LSRSEWLSRLPNFISVFRLIAAPILLMMAHRQMPDAFAYLLIPALFSDVADGWLARKLHCESEIGSLLDSVADITLMAVIIVSIWFLHPTVYQQHWPIIATVFVVWSIAHLLALLRYGRPASFHTRLLQSGILLFGLFALILFTHDFVPWMLYLAGIVSLIGAIEHFFLLVLVKEWTPNIRGGLLEVLLKRRDGVD
jgi:phosphatidylglycerophosphate synthase